MKLEAGCNLTKKNMSLLFVQQRGNSGGVDDYYDTPYKDVFLHRFVSVDHKVYWSAQKIVADKKTLVVVKREIIPILGGIGSTTHISRQTMEESLKDAKLLSKKKRESKTLGYQHYSNHTLWEKIISSLKEEERANLVS